MSNFHSIVFDRIIMRNSIDKLIALSQFFYIIGFALILYLKE